MTRGQEAAAIVIGVGMAIVILVLVVGLGLVAYEATDQQGNERAHPPSEWRR